MLDGIDFIVKSGDKAGIIGANDFGKATLLKLIGGKMPPTSRRVRVRGQIAPLSELGAGFDGELSVEGVAFRNGGKIKVCARY